MRRLPISACVAIATFLFCSAPVSAQSGLVDEPVFQDGFDGGNIGIWSLSPDPLTFSLPQGEPTTSWDMDANPTVVGGGEYSHKSPPNSLNYNNWLAPYDYNMDNSPGSATHPVGLDGTGNSGFATSPVIDISSLVSPVFVFQCNYETEVSSLDFRGVLIQDSDNVDQVFIQYFPPGVTSTIWSSGTTTLQTETCDISGK